MQPQRQSAHIFVTRRSFLAHCSALIGVAFVSACASAAPSANPTHVSTPKSEAPPAQPKEQLPARLSTPQGTLKIAIVGPMTGPGSADLLLAMKGAQLAVDQKNATGGINGKKVVLVMEDDKADPKEAANVAQKLGADPEILAVAHGWNSSPTIAAAPIFRDFKLVQVSYFAVSPKLSGISPYTFRVISTGEHMANFLADWIIKDDGHRRIATFYENTDFGKGLFDVFRERVRQNGGELVAVEAVLIDQKDFSAIVSKFKAANPQVVVVFGQYEAVAFFQKQAADIGFKVPLYGSDGIFAPELIRLCSTLCEGVRSAVQFDPNSDDPIVKRFVEDYQKAYGVAPSAGAGYAYDAINLILMAMEKGGTTREAIHQWLSTNVKGIRGVTGTITFDEKHDRKLEAGTYMKLIIKGGKFVRLEG